MSAEPAPLRAGDPRPGAVRVRVSGALHRRPALRGLLLLTPPAAWFVLLYLAALVVLFVSAFWIVFSYSWLPFMILPVWAAIERVPDSLLEASADMGARGATTFRRVLLPLILPGLAAGSIFTFSLTLGDFITPTLVGGAGSDFIGNVVYRSVGVANDVPFAAAFAVVPLVIMGLYLALARRLGAFEAL